MTSPTDDLDLEKHKVRKNAPSTLPPIPTGGRQTANRPAATVPERIHQTPSWHQQPAQPVPQYPDKRPTPAHIAIPEHSLQWSLQARSSKPPKMHQPFKWTVP